MSIFHIIGQTSNKGIYSKVSSVGVVIRVGNFYFPIKMICIQFRLPYGNSIVVALTRSLLFIVKLVESCIWIVVVE